MSYLITFLIGVLLGAVAGILAYRNNQAKVEAEAKKAEEELTSDKAKAKALLDALKGR